MVLSCCLGSVQSRTHMPSTFRIERLTPPLNNPSWKLLHRCAQRFVSSVSVDPAKLTAFIVTVACMPACLPPFFLPSFFLPLFPSLPPFPSPSLPPVLPPSCPPSFFSLHSYYTRDFFPPVAAIQGALHTQGACKSTLRMAPAIPLPQGSSCSCPHSGL